MADDFSIETGSGNIRITGALDLYHIAKARKVLRKSQGKVDISGITRLDTAGAMLLKNLAEKNKNLKIDFAGLSKEYQQIFELIKDAPAQVPPHPAKIPPLKLLIQQTGKGAELVVKDSYEILSFLGKSCIELVKAFSHPRHLRFGAISNQVMKIGLTAVPIISLMAFLISVVIAYQGIAQLRPLGAEQYTVNMVAISVMREMGVLLTAIMVAGRSGSAFTAEIGVMKVREEVDALRTIGVDPFEILVVPRLIALIIALPILAFIADFMGLLGGAILSKELIGLSVPDFFDRVRHISGAGHALFVGIVKAPFFAIAIGVIGCMHGMKVSGSAESVGKETTASVVKAIFIVLMIDAIASIFFEQVGI